MEHHGVVCIHRRQVEPFSRIILHNVRMDHSITITGLIETYINVVVIISIVK